MAIFLVLIASAVCAGLFRYYVKKDAGDALLASILFAPAMLFWIQDKAVSELAGFGLSAKFSEASQKAVSSVAVEIKDLAVFSPAANDPNIEQSAYWEVCVDYFVVRPSRIPQAPVSLAKYIVNASYLIRTSIACGQFIGVVVLDDNDRYLGSYDRDFFAESLSIWAVPDADGPIDRQALSSRIMSTTMFGASLKFPDKRIVPGEGFVAMVDENATIKSAFGVFQKTKASFLVITDATRKFKGILPYKAVSTSLLSILLDAGKK